MKIIAWNCNMAFRNKAKFILAEHPDIVVVPECEHPDKLIFPAKTRVPNDIFWHGTNEHKGIGVFSYSNYKFDLLNIHNPDFKHILPLAVSGGKIDFTLFAIWANNPADKDGAYVTQIWKALKSYNHLLKNKKTILAGDFNSNTIWDRPRREGNHSALVEKLALQNIHSTYHHYHKQVQGKEKHPTQYMYRHQDKPYHLDYCFASKDFVDKIESVKIGSYRKWSKYSDHTPVIVSFKL